MRPALLDPSVRWKRHESVMNSVIGRGVRNGSAASCTRESHEGRSHASSTSESKLVAHPVGSSNVSGQLFIGKFNTVIADLDSNGQTELAEALKTLESLPNGITSRGLNWGSRTSRPKNK